ncbi:MAG: response regulator [Spirochaetes bacterium]|jgi:response regulator RpfG family c-di-GMP phosphodiesterase|nr:response regulator [Spirochaetota bacterium]
MTEPLVAYNEQITGMESARVLVVDDERSVRFTLVKFLSLKGFHVLEASNGQEAFDILHRFPFDLVITDLQMPVADGRFLLKKMAESFPNIPRMILTAHEQDDDVLLALKTGAYDFLRKPISDFSMLLHSVNRALERKKLHDDRTNTILKMEHINEVVSMLNKGKGIDEIFQMLTVSLRHIIEFNRITLFDLHDDKGVISVRLSDSDRPENLCVGDEIVLSEDVLDNIKKNREVIILADLHSFFAGKDYPADFYKVLPEGFTSAIITPLITDDLVHGFLVLASINQNFYTVEDSRFLTAIAGQISFSIERGRLLSELSIHSRHLEKMVKIRTSEIMKTQKTTIFALSKLAETRDNETGEHLERMRNYSLLLSQLLKYTGGYPEINNEFLKNIYDSSILHDVGKVGIPDAILLKPAPLTTEEFEMMKTHTSIGYSALNEASRGLGGDSYLNMSKDVALYHHERWDGKGYPSGKSGEDIPLSARIVTIGDIYDALTTKRPYKGEYSHSQAVTIMQEEFFRFDPNIFDVFVKNSSEFERIQKQFS